MIFGMGMIESGVTFSFTQLLLDDQIVNDTKKLIRIDLDTGKFDDPRGLNSRMGKGFPSQRIWSPHRVRGLLSLGIDLKSCSLERDIVQDAQQKVQTILDWHKPEPLTASVIHKIGELIMDAEERKEGKRWRR